MNDSGRKVPVRPNSTSDCYSENIEMNTENNKISSETTSSSTKVYSIHDLYKIIQTQQSTINKMTQEVSFFSLNEQKNFFQVFKQTIIKKLTKKSQTIPRELHEKILNELEVI
jgi:hypothetical protein